MARRGEKLQTLCWMLLSSGMFTSNAMDSVPRWQVERASWLQMLEKIDRQHTPHSKERLPGNRATGIYIVNTH